MIIRPSLRLGFLVLAVLIFLAAATAVAAANTVPVTALGDSIRGILPNDLKPYECSGFYVANLVVGSGKFRGTNGNDLILGGSGADDIDGRQGQDCILGGGGADKLSGNQNDDVLIGGPGDDNLDGGGEDTGDACYAAGGSDTFKNCEAEYP